MQNARYGDLDAIWRKTDGRCHLCHESVDLDTYGLLAVYGRDTATVDHLVPQAFGGDDDHDNLMPAHHGCNASRGTRDVEDVRYALAGSSRCPSSGDERAFAAFGFGALGAGLAGNIFATTNADGTRSFNVGAALIGGFLGAVIGGSR